MRPFRNALLLAICAILCSIAHAQDRIQLYATLNVSHASSIPSGLVGTAGSYQTQYNGLTLAGLGGGASLDVLRFPLLSVAVDIHGATHHGVAAASALETGVYGIKIASRVPHTKLKPWVEGSAGFLDAHAVNVSSPGTPQAANPTYASHYAIYTATAGVDYLLARHFDIRVLDIGGGSSFGAAPGVSLFSVDTGLVLHF